jgi:gliding motility-associated lipoprotein GldH
MRIKLGLGFLFVLLGFSACDSNRVYDEYKTLPNQWNKDSIITFNVTPPDSTNAYNVFVNLRNTGEYKYSNLFVIISTRFPNGKVITDTLEYRMTKPNGEFLGTGFSDLKENKLWYKEDVVFRESGVYQFTVQHAMRENGKVDGIVNLEGITDVGIRIEKSLK